MEYEKLDQYGRILGIIFLGETDINLQMVKDGCAWHYKHFDKTPAYAEAERGPAVPASEHGPTRPDQSLPVAQGKAVAVTRGGMRLLPLGVCTAYPWGNEVITRRGITHIPVGVSPTSP